MIAIAGQQSHQRAQAMPGSRPNERSSTPKPLGGEVRAAACAQPGPGSASEELATLYAALDNIENGVMLLDHELRLRYANPALHAMFKSPQSFIDSKPLYAEMLEHARRSSAYAISPDELKQYVAARL